MQTYTVSTETELLNAFSEASAGDTILLAPGLYDGAFLRGGDFSSGGLTITSLDAANPAVFTDRVVLRDCVGVTLSNVEIASAQLADSSSDFLLSLRNCDDVTVSNVLVEGYVPTAAEGKDPTASTTNRTDAIAGYGYSNGLRVMDSSNIVVENLDITGHRVAAHFDGSSAVTFRDSEIHDVREGLNFYDMVDLDITGNKFYDFKPWWPDNRTTGTDHPDMIQYWGVNSSIGLHDITISNNLFHQAEDLIGTQTIFGHMRSAPAGVTATDFTITDNVIINGHANGIRLADLDGVVVSNNLMLPNSWSASQEINIPKLFFSTVTNATLADNVVVEWNTGMLTNMTLPDLVAAGFSLADNLQLTRDSLDAYFWKAVFNAVNPDPEAVMNSGGTYADVLFGMLGSPTAKATNPDHDPNTTQLNLIEGTDQNDVLRGNKEDSLILGYGGNDIIYERKGSEVMVGGSGADRFIFDFRSTTDPAAHDVIVDLDFGEGDTLQILSGNRGTFSNAAYSGNHLHAFNNGSTARIDSKADLREAMMSDGITIESNSAGDGVVIAGTANPFQTLELLGYSLDEILTA